MLFIGSRGRLTQGNCLSACRMNISKYNYYQDDVLYVKGNCVQFKHTHRR